MNSMGYEFIGIYLNIDRGERTVDALVKSHKFNHR
jgi:hypothetical protein